MLLSILNIVEKYRFLELIQGNFFSKNGLHHFLGEPSGYLHAKCQKNLPSGYREKLVTDGRTNGRTQPKLQDPFPHIFGGSKNRE